MSLTQWFNEKWVDLSRPKKGGGFEPCGRDDAKSGKYPKCVPAARAARMTPEQIESAIRRKRMAESREKREGKKPIMVETVSKENVPVNAELYARVKAAAKAKFDVYPSAYANAWLVAEYKRRGGKYKVKKGESAGHPFRGNQWTKGNAKSSAKAVKTPTVQEIKKLVPVLSNKLGEHGTGDWARVEDLVESGVSKAKAKRILSSKKIKLSEYKDPLIATGNCGFASDTVMITLHKMGIKDVYRRETGGPDMWGTHFVAQVGRRGDPNAVIIDYTLRQFFPKAPFPYVGTVSDYKKKYSSYGKPKTLGDSYEDIKYRIENIPDES